MEKGGGWGEEGRLGGSAGGLLASGCRMHYAETLERKRTWPQSSTNSDFHSHSSPRQSGFLSPGTPDAPSAPSGINSGLARLSSSPRVSGLPTQENQECRAEAHTPDHTNDPLPSIWCSALPLSAGVGSPSGEPQQLSLGGRKLRESRQRMQGNSSHPQEWAEGWVMGQVRVSRDTRGGRRVVRRNREEGNR